MRRYVSAAVAVANRQRYRGGTPYIYAAGVWNGGESRADLHSITATRACAAPQESNRQGFTRSASDRVGGETGDARHSDRDGRRGRYGRGRSRREPRPA